MSVRRGATHACPGCGAQVANRWYACGGCWHRLPSALRQAILDAWSARVAGAPGAMTSYSIAVRDARDWYRANPPHPPAVAT